MGPRQFRFFTGHGSLCMACGVDLWDVYRYVSAGSVVICQSCVDALKRAADDAPGAGEIAVEVPAPLPRVQGTPPDDEAAAAITRAFTRTFASDVEDLDNDLEDATEVGA